MWYNGCRAATLEWVTAADRNRECRAAAEAPLEGHCELLMHGALIAEQDTAHVGG